MGWFSPKCPVDSESKAWLDEAFGWLVEEFGIDALREITVVLPTSDFFPDGFENSDSGIGDLFDVICEYMAVDPDLIDLKLYENFDESSIHPFAANDSKAGHELGVYQRGVDGKCTVSLDRTQGNRFEQLVATIAHELGYVILIGEDRLDESYEDMELMTDLVPVFYGLGVFSANSSIVFEQWTNAQYQGWQASSAGYLTEEAFGYALGLFAYLRGEEKPEWAKYLATNPKSYFKSSINYLRKTNDTPLAAMLAAK